MSRSFASTSRLLALITGAALLSAPAIARDVTVYGGGKSQSYQTGGERPVRVIEYGRERETREQRRVKRFQTERKVRSILDTRDTDEARETSDAMTRIILSGHNEARRETSLFYPYYIRSEAFYDALDRKLDERKSGVRVYRQSVLDKTLDADLDRVAAALNETD